ncbi:hypothetical protein AWB65_01255 [Caballeronia humi]|uniref:Uncharacterized protein n=1 Tax=Caballeronia humi TaxID=326474 RepID=A0A158FTD7_9BURK|nr:hypothetical protein AWB65_01255 [Caballeronia humi]
MFPVRGQRIWMRRWQRAGDKRRPLPERPAALWHREDSSRAVPSQPAMRSRCQKWGTVDRMTGWNRSARVAEP